MKNFTLATVNTVNEKCVNWSRAIKKFFRIKKFESLAFQELVNHSCLGEGECRHPFEQNSDQKFLNEVYQLFFWRNI